MLDLLAGRLQEIFYKAYLRKLLSTLRLTSSKTSRYFSHIQIPNHGGIRMGKTVRRLGAPTYNLKSGRQKCLKAESGAKRNGRRDRAKKDK